MISKVWFCHKFTLYPRESPCPLLVVKDPKAAFQQAVILFKRRRVEETYPHARLAMLRGLPQVGAKASKCVHEGQRWRGKVTRVEGR